MNNLQDRHDHLLWVLMEFDIHRYLMSNTEGRCDGAEKAERHINLSNYYVASVRLCDICRASRRAIADGRGEQGEIDELVWKVHNHTQALTSYMDEVIGFPLTGRPDYDDLSPKFFKEFIRLAREVLP